MFIDQYIKSVNTSDLRDDAHHHATEPLHASASADRSGGMIPGSLLARVKYASGAHKLFESGTADLAELQRLWIAAVQQKGKERGWVKVRAEWDITAAHKLYEHIARVSLAYWIDPRCEPCAGAGVTTDRRTCGCCKGTGRAALDEAALAAERIKDMVSELEGIYQAHGGRAAGLLRRAA